MATSRDIALLALRAAEERKAKDLVLLDLAERTLIADYFLIASGDTARQVKAVAEHIEDTLVRAGTRLLHREGLENAKWVLLDFGGVVCHVFSKADRDFYGLERFWGDAPRVFSPSGEPARPRRRSRSSP